MIKIINISKEFPGRGKVLDNFSIEILEGDSLAITGPSGSGKTTLMNIIGSLDKPDSGDIIFKDKSLLSLTPDECAVYRNTNIGFVFQQHLLMPHLTIKENIMLPLFASKIDEESYKQKQEYAFSLMKRTGIESLANKYPNVVSGGEAQRVSLVRALINRPSLLLADEPTGSLDAKNADILGNLLVELNEELHLTIITATHSDALAEKMKRHLRLGSLR